MRRVPEGRPARDGGRIDGPASFVSWEDHT